MWSGTDASHFSQEKQDMSHFLQVQWNCQYFAFVGFQNWRIALQRLYRISLISLLDMISTLISNVCVPCVYYKFSSVHKCCFIYISQLNLFIHVRLA